MTVHFTGGDRSIFYNLPKHGMRCFCWQSSGEIYAQPRCQEGQRDSKGQKRKHGGCWNGYQKLKRTTEGQPTGRATRAHEGEENDKHECAD